MHVLMDCDHIINKNVSVMSPLICGRLTLTMTVTLITDTKTTLITKTIYTSFLYNLQLATKMMTYSDRCVLCIFIIYVKHSVIFALS